MGAHFIAFKKPSSRASLAMRLLPPGFILSIKAFLDEKPHPSDDEIREYLSGNLCRCAGYADILRAVQLAQTRIADSAR